MKNASTAINAVFRDKGKAVLFNAHAYRVDLMRSYDGIFDEHGDDDGRRTAIGWICSAGKICSAWNHFGPETNMSYDLFLQQHLYMGIYPMIPFAKNDHAIVPGNHTQDQAFLDYGLLFAELRGNRGMDLREHPIMVLNSTNAVPDSDVAAQTAKRKSIDTTTQQLPKANVFKRTHNDIITHYVAVLVASDISVTSATFRLAYPLSNQIDPTGYAFLPGSKRGLQIPVSGALEITAPLYRGCVVVVISNT